MQADASQQGEITRLLADIRVGSKEAESELILLVYGELRRLARKYMRQEAPGHTLQTTALVHEAYLRLLGDGNYNWQDRSHFFSVIGQTMRRILVDYARARRAEKRGGDARQVDLDSANISTEERWDDIILVNDSLSRLAAVDSRHVRLVELKVFAGLSVEEIAGVLGVTTRTVSRNWNFVKAWLYADMTDSHPRKQAQQAGA
jgi:RNA polymerase sigma factor (TIGR02999 family)